MRARTAVWKAGLPVVVLYCMLALASPAPAADAGSLANDGRYAPLVDQLTGLLAGERGTYGVYLLDLRTGSSLGINHQTAFHAASTFKLPMNLYLYREAAAGRVDLREKLTYLEEDYEGGTGVLLRRPPGGQYDIATLSRYSIVYSDNIATNMLLRRLGKAKVKEAMRGWGGMVVDDKQNITCPQDMALYMYRLLEFAGTHPAEGEILLNHLGNTVFNDRIPKLLPPGTGVAHKIGNWHPTGTYNDVGYVEHPRNPYIIAVFSKQTPGAARAYSVIQRISRLVYDYQSRLIEVRVPAVGGEPAGEAVIPAFVDENSRTQVPLRPVAEALGARVEWDADTGGITVAANKTVKLALGRNAYLVDGVEYVMDTAPAAYNGCTFVPLRFVAQALGITVDWEPGGRAVTVRSGESF